METGKRDYYEVLGVPRGASDKDIKTAYRKLARACHPDFHPNDQNAERKFKELNEAYAVLSNDEARKKYDQWGHAGGPSANGQGFDFSNFDFSHGAGSFSGFGQTYQSSGFDDIINELFGGMRGRGAKRTGFGAGRQARGRDIESELAIEFSDAIHGAKKTVNLEWPDGARTISFNVPAGVTDGTRIRVPGKGLAGTGGAGDLYVRLRVKPDPRFSRDGDHLRTSVGISIAEAVCGAKIPVPTPEGPTTISIPPGTQGGQVFRVAGKGVRRKSGPAGDLLVTIKIVVPRDVGEAGRELIRRFDGEHPVRAR
ncbi:J domain-containing protein [bacterium]|nr:J domain-containing protein [bacterium]